MTTKKHIARICRVVFVLCLLASADIVQARHASDKAYKGGNFTLEFGAFTSAGSKISFPGFSLTPVGGLANTCFWVAAYPSASMWSITFSACPYPCLSEGNTLC